ncbi:YqhV family protein [Peptococcaceae bacterium]|nr:YqhV family protein [Peptococcaceae bacterium]MCL0062837.1 YqhV family protein [Peptococcaceae bacterium]MCL0100837.1 YqhV family protein [Peptococcaceae bacterium]
MIGIFDKVVFSMALMRFLSSMIELSAALLMLKFNRVETALQINALLALIGPIILFIVTFLGIIGVSRKLSLVNMLYILAGVVLIFIGVHKK